jgi:group II intron reverse transcriptase/maturase/CRISPR-associated endonuclease Cas1
MNEELFDAICSKETLYNAWQKVKEKNTTGGVDRTTIKEYSLSIDEQLEKLSQQLQSGTYVQQPYREVFIPKKENQKRRLGILTINDKVVQTAVYEVLMPLFERSFLPVSYAYRKNKSAAKAIREVQRLLETGKYQWLISCDIDNYFDTISHKTLLGKLSGYLKNPNLVELLAIFIKMGSVDHKFHWKQSNQGLSQGGVLSPLLANFYLYPLDKLLIDNSCGYVRYADDFVILCETEEKANQVLDMVNALITNQLKLSLNEGETVVPAKDGFEFLGIFFKNGGLCLSDKKRNRLVEKMDNASNLGSELITEKLKETVKGMAPFYGKLLPEKDLEALDIELLRIIRSRYDLLISRNIRIKNPLKTVGESIEFLSKSFNLHKDEHLHRVFEIKRSVNQSDTQINPKKSRPFNSQSAVIKRKHEYQKLEASGFDLVLCQSGLMLGKKENAVIVKRNDVVIEEVQINNLKNITLISNGICLSTNVIQLCCENNVSLDFLRYNGTPFALLTSDCYPDSEIGLAQLDGYRNLKGCKIIKIVITGKISNQINLIKYFGKYHTSRNEVFNENYTVFLSKMAEYKKSVKTIADVEMDELRQKIFAYEGLASNIYWGMVKLLINKKLVFEGRTKENSKDLFNCMLNYGYGILYARISEAIQRAKLNPCLSYLHKPERNRPSLVYDLIEEFRQQSVDRVVIALIVKNKGLNCVDGLLDDKTKSVLVQKIIARLNEVENFRGREMRLFEIIQNQAFSLAKFLTGVETSYKPYIKKW